MEVAAAQEPGKKQSGALSHRPEDCPNLIGNPRGAIGESGKETNNKSGQRWEGGSLTVGPRSQ